MLPRFQIYLVHVEFASPRACYTGFETAERILEGTSVHKEILRIRRGSYHFSSLFA